MLLGQAHHVLTAAFIQFAIGRIRDGFLLDGAIHRYRFKILLLDGLAVQASLNRHR